MVFIGSGKNWPSYPELCKQFLGDRLTIIEHLPQPMLASAFAAANVHVLPSWMETCGLVTLEAALPGTPVVGSTFGHELEYLRQDTWWCHPGDPDSVKDAVEQAGAQDGSQQGQQTQSTNLERLQLAEHSQSNRKVIPPRALWALAKAFHSLQLTRNKSVTMEITGRERNLILADTAMPL